MTVLEWCVICAVVAIPLFGMLNLSFTMGKVVSELQSIRTILSGHVDWIKTIDARTIDHDRRIIKLEIKRGGNDES